MTTHQTTEKTPTPPVGEHCQCGAAVDLDDETLELSRVRLALRGFRLAVVRCMACRK